MKVIDKYIIKSFIGPFFITFLISMFVLLMQFLWKWIEDLVGKGLEWHIIAELLLYTSSSLVPLALPLSVLLSSLMLFGNLGEKLELLSFKSAGISLLRIMLPLMLISFLISVLAFYFSNVLLPLSNLKMAALLYNITHKKPTIEIKPKVFYKGIDGYTLRIESKENDGKTLNKIMIYDHTERKGNNKVITALKGKMEFSEDKRYLILTLFKGHTYYEEIDNRGRIKNYPLLQSSFDEDIIRFDLSDYKFQRTSEDLFKDHCQMMNLSQLKSSIDTLRKKNKERIQRFKKNITNTLFFLSDTINYTQTDSLNYYSFINSLSKIEKIRINSNASNIVRAEKMRASAVNNEIESRKKFIIKHYIEWHKKFTLSIACLILFFIGAPFGAIIRKGGFGMPVVLSVILFIIFHILSIIGEKMVKEGVVQPFIGMWMATFILLPVGIYLTFKATKDSALFNIESYINAFNKVLKIKTSID